MSAPIPTPSVPRPGRSWILAALALSGILLGAYLVISSRSFPPGLGSLPGPGFFPLLLGILILLFSAMIAREAWSPAPQSPGKAAVRQADKLPALAVLMVIAWLLTWDFAPFLLRTPLLVLGLMRTSGSNWRSAALSAILFTAALYAIFQLGLRVDLG